MKFFHPTFKVTRRSTMCTTAVFKKIIGSTLSRAQTLTTGRRACAASRSTATTGRRWYSSSHTPPEITMEPRLKTDRYQQSFSIFKIFLKPPVGRVSLYRSGAVRKAHGLRAEQLRAYI